MDKSLKTALPSLGSFLTATGGEGVVMRLDAPISTVHDITALQYALQEKKRYPIVFAEKPLLPDGRESALPVVCNLNASRAVTAAALGLADHRAFAKTYASAVGSPIAPLMVSRSEAPVQEVVQHGDQVNLLDLPALTQHVGDPGPYLTAAHATTYDPDTLIDNVAIQRCWLKGADRMSYFPYPATHNARNMRKFWERGEDCPIAFWIGHHPLVLMGCQAKMGYPESHLSAAGGLLGQPLRVAPSITHGERILVPADAEIVIEGWIPKDEFGPDGPFGEYTGYLGPQVIAPVCNVTCITRRRGAIYHDYGSGLDDMLVPDNMAMEGKLYAMVKQVAPSLVNVHAPTSGRRFHAYLQFANPAQGEARDGLMAALSYRRVKTAIAVNGDVDLFSESDMLWALATRVQWDRDSINVSGLSGSMLDPSLPEGARTASKLGIDATVPPGTGSGPSPSLPRSRVPESALERARALLSSFKSEGWPEG